MRCANCNKVIGPHDIKDGLCEECYTPENVKKVQQGEVKTYDDDMIELVHGDDVKRVGYKFDLGVLFWGLYRPLLERDTKGFLTILVSGVVFFGALMFLREQMRLPDWTVYAGIAVFFVAMGMIYPKMRIQNLLRQGYRPADSHSKKVLSELGLDQESDEAV